MVGPGEAAGSARRHHRTLGEAEVLRLDVAEVDRGLEHDLQSGLWIRIHINLSSWIRNRIRPTGKKYPRK